MADKIFELCWFNKRIECDVTGRCEKCGWNPHNTELRQKRIEKALERLEAHEQSNTAH